MAGYRAKPRWTARQEAYVIENYGKMKDEEIANILGKTVKSIRRKRERLHLKKSGGRPRKEKPVVTPATPTVIDVQ
jgi:hypothetical protein